MKVKRVSRIIIGKPIQIPFAQTFNFTLLLFVSIWFQILFHSPHRGTFHLSLTVLVHYRLQEVFSLIQWVGSLPTAFHINRSTQEYNQHRSIFFIYWTITVYGLSFQRVLLKINFVTMFFGLTVPKHCTLQHLNCNSFCNKWFNVIFCKAESNTSSYLLRFGLFPFRSPLLGESHS